MAQAVGHFGRSQPHSFEDLRGDQRRGHGDALAGEYALGEQIDVLAGVVGVVRECEFGLGRHWSALGIARSGCSYLGHR